MKLTLSNSFIAISAVFTFLSFSNQEIFLFGMNSYFLNSGDYLRVFFQFLFYSFLHGSILHLFFNASFLYYFGNQVEDILGFKKYLIFFILSTIFNGVSILIFASGNTIGISGFCMALLSFFTIKLYDLKNPEYKGGLSAILVNIAIGLTPGISLVGHLFGAVFGGVFYLGEKLYKKLGL